MTREEELINVTYDFYPGVYSSSRERDAFMRGFRYADEHPRKELVDLEQNYKEVINKLQNLIKSSKSLGHIIVRVDDLENAFPEIQRTEME